MPHANARIGSAGRLILVRRIMSGRAIVQIASEWAYPRRTRGDGGADSRPRGVPALEDRSSVAKTNPGKAPRCAETRVRILPAVTRRGPVFIRWKLVLPSSQPWVRFFAGIRLRCSVRLPLSRVYVSGHPDFPGARYERQTPGDLIHVDVMKLARVPDGVDWRAHG